MHLPILAVDKEGNSLKREEAWLKHGVNTICVASMGEAIEKLCKGSYFFITINADNIYYKPQFNIMRDVAATYVFIFTSNYLPDVHTEALKLGADGYIQFQSSPDKDVEHLLALIDRYNEITRRCPKSLEDLSFRGFCFYPQYRQLFYNDVEIHLTKKEFDLLHFFIKNKHHALSHEQIFENVWGEEYSCSVSNVLSSVIRRLRKKLSIMTVHSPHMCCQSAFESEASH